MHKVNALEMQMINEVHTISEKVSNYKCYHFACWVNLHVFVVVTIFSKFSKKSFRNTIRESNSLDPYLAPHFAEPDLGSNCFLKLSEQTTKVVTGRSIVKKYMYGYQPSQLRVHCCSELECA